MYISSSISCWFSVLILALHTFVLLLYLDIPNSSYQAVFQIMLWICNNYDFYVVFAVTKCKICSFRKVRRVNSCGLLSVREEPGAKTYHITTPPQSIHSRLNPYPALCKREQKSMVSKRLHIKLLNTLLTGALKTVPFYRYLEI